MKFDYIIGNPPYQEPKLETDIKRDSNGSSKLFYTILRRFYHLFNVNMAMVTPAKIGSTAVLFKVGLKEYHLEGDVFDLGLQIATWKLTKDYKGPVDVYYPSGLKETKSQHPIFPEHLKKDFEIFNRSKKYVKDLCDKNELGRLGPGAKREMKHKKDEEYIYPVQVKVNSTVGKEYFMYSKVEFKDDDKIVIPLSQKLYPKTVLRTTNNFNNLFYQIPTTGMTTQEIENVQNFCKSVSLQIYSEFVAKVIGSLRYWHLPQLAKTKLTEEEIQESLGLKDDWEYIMGIPQLQGHIKFAESQVT